MYPALIGKKIGMTQVYDATGAVQPVTVVQAGPCVVLQVKDAAGDGYEAAQLGFQDVKPQRATRAAIGHAAKAGTRAKKVLREIRVPPGAKLEAAVGETWTVQVFEGVIHVDVIGPSKGKGMQGVMKRYHFGGQPGSHGTERKHRSPGSIGALCSNRGFGGGLKKGKRMAGHMGPAQVTSRNHKLVGIDPEHNLLLIKGSVPGAANGYVFVRKSVTARVKQA